MQRRVQLASDRARLECREERSAGIGPGEVLSLWVDRVPLGLALQRRTSSAAPKRARPVIGQHVDRP